MMATGQGSSVKVTRGRASIDLQKRTQDQTKPLASLGCALWLLWVLRWLLRRILRGLLGIPRVLARLLAERTLAGLLTDRLPDWLAQTCPSLQARLPHAECVFGWIPDKLEEAVVFCVIVDDHRFFVDLAA